MIDRTHASPVTRQCQLLDLNRSTVYYQPVCVSDGDLRLMRLIDEIHLKPRSMAAAGFGIICRIWDTRSIARRCSA